ncbi:MAG: ATP-binding protein [Saprospiraceae bacterium]|nr:hypothetical protein [Saprospiraceae bacterium]MDW8228462.1 ATP-binding protein [Saprospiraceae bacterium]
MEPFIGRHKELQILRALWKRERSDFVAIFGRRRVGKTFLVREAFYGQFDFQVTGLANTTTRRQLENFHAALLSAASARQDYPMPQDWFEAFRQLADHLGGLPAGRKKVVFIDELPWMDTPKSEFISALEHFWNAWASARADILLVVCGSASSWMIHRLLMNTGGLYNRVTSRIKLEPFTLAECEAYFTARGAAFNRYQIIQLYMVLGGIPFYLEQVDVSKSALQNINDLCFAANGFLRSEFSYLFASLFKHSERHVAIVEVLAQKTKGMVREEIIRKAGLPNGGNTTKALLELEESGFIRKYQAFDRRSKEALYQLADFYTLFYLKFIQPSSHLDNYVWSADAPAFNAWSGYAFEQVCLQHVEQIKKALGVSGVITRSSAWTGADGDRKAQVDLVIDRRDGVINLCEIKFSTGLFSIDKRYAEELREKVALFKRITGTKKAVFLTFITTFGLASTPHTGGLVQSALTMDALFKSES